MEHPLIVSIAPHIKSAESTKRIMWSVVGALLPAGAAGVFIFGLNSLYLILTAVISAALAEAAVLAFRKKPIALADGSAVLTGLLLAYNLPPGTPLWLSAAGAVFAIIIGKQVFGGLGHNIFNPALAGRAFLMVSWPAHMTTWQNPRWQADAVTTATPLAQFKEYSAAGMVGISHWDLLIGNRGGCIGEVCAIALLAGAAFLFLKRYISWHIPCTYLGSVAVLSWAFNSRACPFGGDAVFFLLSGGVVLGAFFMATDYVTSPLSARGRLIFGTGCGILTFIIRRFAGYPEGVSYAILIMNAAVPVIDRYTCPRWFGYVKRG